MKKFWCIFAVLLVCNTSCDNSYLESDNVEELVVEGWIESGHAPVVFVTSTLPVSSTPQPLSNIADHLLRYAEVYVEHNGERYYLTARLTDSYVIKNYFTSSVLRGVPGETYRLYVKWLDYEASAVCTIPEPPLIDTASAEKAGNGNSYIAKITFHNNPEMGKFYQSFRRIGDETGYYEAVNFTTLNGAEQDTVITETFMRPLDPLKPGDVYFHPGDTVSLKLATIEQPMYEFWKSFANYSSSSGTVFSAPTNVKGNVDGAIGYWAGYGIDIREIVIE